MTLFFAYGTPKREGIEGRLNDYCDECKEAHHPLWYYCKKRQAEGRKAKGKK